MTDRVIIFYDGDCGFCNRWVAFFLKRNPGYFYFAPLQGPTAKILLGRKSPYLHNLSTLVVRDLAGRTLTQSTAALYLLSHMRGYSYQWVKIFYLLPTFLRNAIYAWVAKHRYDLGIADQCHWPSDEERLFFLDLWQAHEDVSTE